MTERLWRTWYRHTLAVTEWWHKHVRRTPSQIREGDR